MCAQATIIPFEADPSLHESEPQTRGYMVGLVRNLSPAWIEEEIGRAAEAGFNLAVFPSYINGWTLFPSAAAREAGMPPINPLLRKWDPMAALAGSAARHGLKLWAFVRPYDFHPSSALTEQRLLRKHPRWRLRAHPSCQDRAARLHEERHACPLNPEYRRTIANLMTELVVGYPMEGIVLDFTGPSLRGGPLLASPYCFCASCRERYRQDAQSDMIEDAVSGRIDEVRAWQKRQTEESLLYLRHRLIRARRSLRFMCRVRPHWRESFMNPVGRSDEREFLDWPALLEIGAIEELVVDHDGEPCHSFFSAHLAADSAYLGDRVMFQPILSIAEPSQIADMLRAVARYPIPGFIAEFPLGLGAADARLIREQCFPQAADVPESDPIMAAIFLIERVRRSHENRPVIHDLLGDFLRLLMRELPKPPKFATLEMIEENLHGLEQFIRRGRLGSIEIPDASMRDLGLARRFVRMACMDVRS